MRMTKRTWLVVGAVIIFVGSALVLAPHLLKKSSILVTLDGLPPISYPGFQLWPTPRTFDPPGTAFILKGDRIEHVADLLKPNKVGVESLVGAKTRANWKGGLLAQFLGTTPAKLAIDSNQEVTVEVEVSEGERWRIDRQALDEAVKHVNWPSEEQGTPYVVTEAISVNSIKYEVSLRGDVGGSLDTSGLGHTATGTLTAQENEDGSYVLNQVFSQPHYIFYQASRINRPPGHAAELRTIPESNQLRWTTEVIGSSTPN